MPALVGHHHHALAGLAARLHVQRGVVGGQAVELVDALLQVAQVQPLARLGRKGAGEVDLGAGAAGVLQLVALDRALDHADLEHAAAQVLRRQVGAGGDVAALDVALGDGRQHRLQVAHRQAAAGVVARQLLAQLRRQQRVAADADLADVAAGHADVGHRDLGLDGLEVGAAARRLLQRPLLLLTQALLLLALDHLVLALDDLRVDLRLRGHGRKSAGVASRRQICNLAARGVQATAEARNSMGNMGAAGGSTPARLEIAASERAGGRELWRADYYITFHFRTSPKTVSPPAMARVPGPPPWALLAAPGSQVCPGGLDRAIDRRVDGRLRLAARMRASEAAHCVSGLPRRLTTGRGDCQTSRTRLR